MSRSESDLVDAIRHELAALIPERRCCQRIELAALADPGRRENIGAVRTIHLLTTRLDEEAHEVAGASAAARSLASARTAATSDAGQHCRRAYLRGRLLARGSLSLAAGRAHLELVLLPVEARFVATILRRESLSAIQRERRGRTVFVWKGEEAVLHLLRSLGGGAALSALEARGVGRQMRNSLNRVVNADTANLRRTIDAGLRQATAARRLLKAGAIDEGGAVGRVAIARMGEPDASLSELAEATGLSRSSVQRALAAIEAAARVLKEETLR